MERLRPAISFEFGVRSYGAYGVKPDEVFDWFATRRHMLLFLEADRTPGLWDFLAVPEENPLARRQAWARQLLID